MKSNFGTPLLLRSLVFDPVCAHTGWFPGYFRNQFRPLNRNEKTLRFSNFTQNFILNFECIKTFQTKGPTWNKFRKKNWIDSSLEKYFRSEPIVIIWHRFSRAYSGSRESKKIHRWKNEEGVLFFHCFKILGNLAHSYKGG